MGAAVFLTGQRRKQPGVVAFVGPRFARVVRRIDARRAAQRLDAQAGVVGERRQSGQAGGMPGFLQRILEKGMVGFFGFGDAEFRLWQHREIERGEQLRELTQLAWIIAGQHQLLHALAGRASSAPLCAATRRAMPS